ncbi:hypothetical protein ACVWYG_003760 [Pedobacter sp. UYEF25]
MKERTLYLLLAVMVLLSIFTGFSINNNFSYLYSYAFVSFPEILLSSHGSANLNIFSLIHWVFLVLSHISMFLLWIFLSILTPQYCLLVR